jgi:hypothetical protein
MNRSHPNRAGPVSPRVPQSPGADAGQADWRARMRWQLAWSLLAKFAALALLWWLFFSDAHDGSVTPESVRAHLGLERASPAYSSGSGTP